MAERRPSLETVASRYAYSEIAAMMDKIRNLFIHECKFSFIVRNTEISDADIVISDDDKDHIIEVVEKLWSAESQIFGPQLFDEEEK